MTTFVTKDGISIDPEIPQTWEEGKKMAADQHTPPPAMTTLYDLTGEAALAAAPDIAETSALTRWDALAADIAYASEQAEGKEFNYRDKWDNKQARSWVAQLRKLKGKIERARKDAKAVHLERGRAVDETAKLLEASVQGLIEPHERELKALEAEEQSRIDAHKAVLERIAALQEGVTTADEAQSRLTQLAAIDPSALEEFATAGANRKLEATEKLQSLWDSLRVQEAERAELEKLRAEKAAREEAERIERIRREAAEAERRSAAEAAQRAEADRLQREAIAAAEAARRQQEAIAAADAARRAQAQAEERERMAIAAANAAQQAEAQRQAEEVSRQQQAEEAREKRAADLELSILAALGRMTREQVAAAIVAGTLHPAVCVDWTRA
jgi:DNA repair exonuclease SbcCD ATPase subunit